MVAQVWRTCATPRGERLRIAVTGNERRNAPLAAHLRERGSGGRDTLGLRAIDLQTCVPRGCEPGNTRGTRRRQCRRRSRLRQVPPPHVGHEVEVEADAGADCGGCAWGRVAARLQPPRTTWLPRIMGSRARCVGDRRWAVAMRRHRRGWHRSSSHRRMRHRNASSSDGAAIVSLGECGETEQTRRCRSGHVAAAATTAAVAADASTTRTGRSLTRRCTTVASARGGCDDDGGGCSGYDGGGDGCTGCGQRRQLAATFTVADRRIAGASARWRLRLRGHHWLPRINHYIGVLQQQPRSDPAHGVEAVAIVRTASDARPPHRTPSDAHPPDRRASSRAAARKPLPRRRTGTPGGVGARHQRWQAQARPTTAPPAPVACQPRWADCPSATTAQSARGQCRQQRWRRRLAVSRSRPIVRYPAAAAVAHAHTRTHTQTHTCRVRLQPVSRDHSLVWPEMSPRRLANSRST